MLQPIRKLAGWPGGPRKASLDEHVNGVEAVDPWGTQVRLTKV